MSAANTKWMVVHGERARCARCQQVRPIGELNVEAIHHHGASKLECLDRKRCEREKRRSKP